MSAGRLALTERFDFNGHAVAYGTIGPADALPVFLLHGTPFNSQVWRRIAPWIARDRRVIFHDLLGYGKSDKPDADVSLGVQNAVFARLLEHLQVESPDVVAHDFGGCTALRAHLLDAVDYNSLTLIDPVAVRPWGSPFVQHVREHQAAFAGMPAYMHETVLRAYLQTAAHRPLGKEAMGDYLAPWTGEAGQRGFYRQITQMDQRYTDEIEGRYSEIRCPLQILWGEKDEWIPIAHGRRFAKMTPAGSLLPIARAGHLVHDDAPEAIVAAVLPFLERYAREA